MSTIGVPLFLPHTMKAILKWESKNVFNIDHEFRTCQVIRKKISQLKLILLLCSRLYKFKDFLDKSKLWELLWKMNKDRHSMQRIMRSKSDNWHKNASNMRLKDKNTEIRLIKWIWFAKNFMRNWRTWNLDLLALIQPFNRNIDFKNKELEH